MGLALAGLSLAGLALAGLAGLALVSLAGLALACLALACLAGLALMGLALEGLGAEVLPGGLPEVAYDGSVVAALAAVQNDVADGQNQLPVGTHHCHRAAVQPCLLCLGPRDLD